MMLVIDHALYVNAPISVTYHHWTRYPEFPRFMEGVVSVKRPTWTRLLWRTIYAGEPELWEARIVCHLPNECLAWESVNHRANHMRLDFSPVAADMTLVTLRAEYEVLHSLEDVGTSLGAVSERLYGDLVRAQQLIEGRTMLPHLRFVALN